MPKSTFTALYEVFRAKLVDLRKAAGLTQRELAERLGRERSFIARIELGERRLDVVEFYWLCRACEKEPSVVAGEVMRELGQSDPARPPKTTRRR